MKNERLKEYFQKYKNLVTKIALDRTGDYHVSQEICQQVFMTLYANMERIPPDYVKAWLMRCTQNAVVDYLRKRKTRGEVFSDLSIAEAGANLTEESMETHEELLYQRELIGRILREVRTVNWFWFEILMLSCVYGLSYTEAAKKLHIPERVLRARMYRARRFIKEKFGDEYRRTS